MMSVMWRKFPLTEWRIMADSGKSKLCSGASQFAAGYAAARLAITAMTALCVSRLLLLNKVTIDARFVRKQVGFHG